RRDGGRWRLNAQMAQEVAVTSTQVTVFRAYGIAFDRVDPLARDGATEAGANVIEAPMPGLVKHLDAAPGQAVQKGDRLAVLEAMKMEHSLLAATDGTVAEVLVAEGAQVTAGAPLVRLEEA
ncbi:MAG: acetyl-CoA carboxylase biotin carboxyl carrier protein subunit, partial [Pseudomonadota bacterium]